MLRVHIDKIIVREGGRKGMEGSLDGKGRTEKEQRREVRIYNSVKRNANKIN